MITRLIPRKVRAWLKRGLISIANEGKPMIYMPYKLGHSGFVIPKTPEQGYDTCSLGLPIPPQTLWLGFSTKEQYLSSGSKQVDNMLELLDGSGFTPEKGSRFLDLAVVRGE